MYDIIRTAAAVPNVSVGNVKENLKNILEKATQAENRGVQLTVFPELSLCGYTCADLFFQQSLLKACIDAVKEIVFFSKNKETILAVGLPLSIDNMLYNCAAVIHNGEICGIVPKTYIPNYNEFYENRWFSSGVQLKRHFLPSSFFGLEGKDIPMGSGLIFDTGSFTFAAELCEDLWATVSPGSIAALNGAEVIINLSASNETISKRAYRRSLISQQSASQISAYIYASAGYNESTTDLIFSGHSVICENGRILKENADSIDNDYILISDIDLGKIRTDRLKIKTFAQSCSMYSGMFEHSTVLINCKSKDITPDFYEVDKLPFVPKTKKDRAQRCAEIFSMQVMGVKKRMEVTNARPVIGVSGGLDSTLALLVCTEAARRAGRPLTDVVGITMPCFGTTDRTYKNSIKLMESLGITAVEIPIKSAVTQHFNDIGHDGKTLDLTFENAQARERTQVLMDYAGKIGGFVAGTGDLSELALGWCTYNADHMSMYGINCSIPKTLVRWMIDSIMEYDVFKASSDILKDILDTPISPELLPPDENGEILQQTEEIVGPYALHDFFLFYVMRYGFAPQKIFELAAKAFSDDFDKKTIKKWLVSFYKRFFSQQFKRSCLPDGVKVGSICLSPRGDWRMPSDASSQLWTEQAENIQV